MEHLIGAVVNLELLAILQTFSWYIDLKALSASYMKDGDDWPCLLWMAIFVVIFIVFLACDRVSKV
jgi:hypothetical protein